MDNKFSKVTILKVWLLMVVLFIGPNTNAQQRKNLLFIITDQQRYDALGIAGNNVVKTPNLDRLAQQGAFFKNAYTQAAVCTPARSSILTGFTIENTGMVNNDKAYYYKEKGLMTMPTFDEILAQLGYHCEYYGKWHSQTSHTKIYKNPILESKTGKSIFQHGGQSYMYQDYLNEVYPPTSLKEGESMDVFTKRPYIPNPMDYNYGKTKEEIASSNYKLIQPDYNGKSTIPKEYTLTAYQAKETIKALERLKDSTFSITCAFHFPHAPMLPSVPYNNMYPAQEMVAPVSIDDSMVNSPYQNTNGRLEHPEYADREKIKYIISDYYGLINEIDHWVGEILNKLEDLGIADNTMVVFTSDHGEMLGAHGMREKNVFYEESAHIPLILSFPHEIPENTIVNGYVSTMDLFATIVDYLKAGNHPSDGKSLRGLINGNDEEHGKYVVTEWNYRGDVAPNYMILMDGWKLMIPFSESSKVKNALYNLNDDPHEMNNLIGNNPEKEKYAPKAEELRKHLLEWLKKNNSKHYNGAGKRKLI